MVDHDSMQVGPWFPVAFLAFALVAAVPAQQPEPSGKPEPPPLHRPRLELPPLAALAHLRQGNLRFQQAFAARQTPPLPELRPSGAGRYVAAVVVCADAGVDAPYLFSLAPRDTLLLSTAGGLLGAAETALLERAVADQRLSLVVVLGHVGCASLTATAADTPAQQALRQRAEAVQALAQQRRIPREQAAAQSVREALLGSSELLRQRVEQGSLLVAPATVEPKTGAVSWWLSRAEQMPLPPAMPK